MSGVVGNWRVELIERYRDLFQPPADFPGAAQGSPDCDAGWYDLLDRMCVRIRAAVQADGGTFKFSQIKEKYGSLRTYWSGTLYPETSAQIEEAIALAEARSAVTCEVCGEEGRLRSGAWLTTRCEMHAEGHRAIEAQPGDDIHIMQRIVGRRRQTLRRRYDRETDSFVDVDPFAAPPEEE